MGHLDKHNSFWVQSQKILNDSEGYFGSYVHSSYYSIIQIIFSKLVIPTKFKSTYDIQNFFHNNNNELLKYFKKELKNENLGYHVFLEIILINEYYRNDTNKIMKIRENFKICRKSRNKADYNKNEINEDEKEFIINSFSVLKQELS